MQRLFIGLSLDPHLCQALDTVREGVEGAFWQRDDQLHLTLVFLGNVSRHQARDLKERLAGLVFEPFQLALKGVGYFGDLARPRCLWAGVEEPAPLKALHDKIYQQIRALDLSLEHRRFKPHVSLARFRKSGDAGRPLRRDNAGHGPSSPGQWLQAHSLLKTPAMRVETITLFTSLKTDEGSVYRPEASFLLHAAAAEKENIKGKIYQGQEIFCRNRYGADSGADILAEDRKIGQARTEMSAEDARLFAAFSML